MDTLTLRGTLEGNNPLHRLKENVCYMCHGTNGWMDLILDGRFGWIRKKIWIFVHIN